MNPLDAMGRRSFLARTGLLGAYAASHGLLLKACGDSGSGTASADTGTPADTDTSDGDSLDVGPPEVAIIDEATLDAVLDALLPRLISETLDGVSGTVVTDVHHIGIRAFVTALIEGGSTIAHADRHRMLEAAASYADAGAELTLPPDLVDVPDVDVIALDAAFTRLLAREPADSEGSTTLTNTAMVALILSLVASRVDPQSLAGPKAAPFANLSVADRVSVLSQLESPDEALRSALESGAPPEWSQRVIPFWRTMVNTLYMFSAVLGYSNLVSSDDPPAGWAAAGYQPLGAVHGWSSLLGYHEGLEEATDP